MRFAILFGFVYLANQISSKEVPIFTVVMVSIFLVFSLLMDVAEYGQRSRKL